MNTSINNGINFMVSNEPNNQFLKYYTEIFTERRYAVPFTVVDIGANIGLYSLYIYNMASDVYAIEPYSKNFEHLKETKELNKLDKLHIFNFALGRANGTGQMHDPTSGNDYGSIVVNDTRGTQIHDTVIKTLNTFLEENNIQHVNICKVDCEGSEKAIAEAEDFDKACSKIDTFIGEYHGNAYETLKARLEGQGFTFTNLPGIYFLAQKI